MNAEMYLITNQLKHALDWILLVRQKWTWKKFVKNLAFLKDQDKITLDVTYKESPDDEELYPAAEYEIIRKLEDFEIEAIKYKTGK